MGRLFLDENLARAARDGEIEQVKKMLAYGADVHAWDDVPLRWAAAKGHTVVVAILVGEGANIHAHDDEALRLAEANGHKDTADFIRDAMKTAGLRSLGQNYPTKPAPAL